MASRNTSNTGKKLVKSKAKGKRGAHLPDVNEATQFKKGYDPRRNLKGRPRSFDQFRALAQDIAEQIATTKDGTPLTWNGQEITFAEFVLLSWVTDKKYLEKFAEAAFGKVPQSGTNLNIDMAKLTDAQLERIAKGEDPLKVLTNAQ
jgi:hypothetical protein